MHEGYLDDIAKANKTTKDSMWQKIKKEAKDVNSMIASRAKEYVKTKVDKTKEGAALRRAQRRFARAKAKKNSTEKHINSLAEALAKAQKAYNDKVAPLVKEIMDEFGVEVHRFSDSDDLERKFENIDSKVKNYVSVQRHGYGDGRFPDPKPYGKLKGRNVQAIGLYICDANEDNVRAIRKSTGVRDIYYSKGWNIREGNDFGLSRKISSSDAKGPLPIIYNPSTSPFLDRMVVGDRKSFYRISGNPKYRQKQYRKIYGESYYTTLEKLER
jgi:hypothetical protein